MMGWWAGGMVGVVGCWDVGMVGWRDWLDDGGRWGGEAVGRRGGGLAGGGCGRVDGQAGTSYKC